MRSNMKKCPFCGNPVGESAILCPFCSRIITEPERTNRQRLKNFIFLAVTAVVLIGIAVTVYFTLGTTPVTAFMKGNAALINGIVNADTPLLDRMKDEAFTADWKFTAKNARHISSGGTGEFKLNYRLQKAQYEAAFIYGSSIGGKRLAGQVAFTNGRNLYSGQPEGQTPASCAVLNGSERIPLADRLPILFMGFKSKDELFGALGGIVNLIAASVDTRYVTVGTGELTSHSNGRERLGTVTLSLDRDGLKSVFASIKDKLGKTPGAYDNLEKMFGQVTGRSIRDVIEKDFTAWVDALKEDSSFTWTVYEDGKTAVAADIRYSDAEGVRRLTVQNGIKSGLNCFHLLLDLPASGEQEALHAEFGLDMTNKGEYVLGKKYGIAMKVDFRLGRESLKAEMQTELVLSQVTAADYHTAGNAVFTLEKNGKSEKFDASYDFSYDFSGTQAMADSPELPMKAIMDRSVRTDTESFLKNFLENFASPFLMDGMEAAGK
jgi:predicted nucleic acid-binding Zn ribbon protein